jgi:hypothetical protein
MQLELLDSAADDGCPTAVLPLQMRSNAGSMRKLRETADTFATSEEKLKAKYSQLAAASLMHPPRP